MPHRQSHVDTVGDMLAPLFFSSKLFSKSMIFLMFFLSRIVCVCRITWTNKILEKGKNLT